MAVRQSPVFVVMRIDDTFDAENNQEKRLNDMSIKINDLTVTFKNKVTGINHANLEIPNGVLDSWEKTEPENHFNESSYHCPYPDQWYGKYGRNPLL